VLEAETLGLPREVDPHTASARGAASDGWGGAVVGAVVADLERGQVAKTCVATRSGGVRLSGDERDRLVKVAKTCVDVGIEERRVRLAESAGAQLAAVVRAVLDRLDSCRTSQRVLALQVVPEEFRRLRRVAVPVGQDPRVPGWVPGRFVDVVAPDGQGGMWAQNEWTEGPAPESACLRMPLEVTA
jgi:hypothetical protein